MGTSVLGPGWRAVIWVQGCPIHCKGCVAPDWISFQPAQSILPADLAKTILNDPILTGITLSGGEPMMQAEGLAEVCRLVRAERPVDIICFSGFTLERLRSHPPSTGVDDLLAQIDVLIDGPYIESMNDNRGMRGSSNQCIHHLTDRLKSYDFQSMPRLAEVLIRDEEMMVAGVPPTHFLKAVKSIN